MNPPLGLLLGLLVSWGAVAAEGQRTIPKPLPNHPGNMFLQGEQIFVALPQARQLIEWQLLDYESNIVSHGTATNGWASPGKLSVGYYELQRLRDGQRGQPLLTIGVLAPLLAPTPRTSPVGVDVSMSWRYTGTEQDNAASLCALAGVNWVRDRLSWQEMEPARGHFAHDARYDDTARKQAQAGLRVLQVYHDSPSWAGDDPKRAPSDLRDAYRFAQAVAGRWRGQVLAFEPWNEADIQAFGGHTGAEIAALQKASYLGLKAGNPDVIVRQNVFASPQPNTLGDFTANAVWPYFDTFNFHHYCPLDEYPAVYAAFRAASAGRPMWITEFSLPVEWAGDPNQQEPTAENLRLQSERVLQVFASALHENPQVAFYFLLAHFCEGHTQFGLLHKDLTPRPGYLALAAVGRLLADAKPLGKMRLGNDVRAFAFRARPDGNERDVIVAWTAINQAIIELPASPIAVFDHLGRERAKATASINISQAPIFVVFKSGSLTGVPLQPAPETDSGRDGFRRVPDLSKAANAVERVHADATDPRLESNAPCPIVLQALIPPGKIAPSLSAYSCSSEQRQTFSIFAYNFGKQKASGKLIVTAPEGWSAALAPPGQAYHLSASPLDLASDERKELTLTVDCRGATTTPADTVRITDDFGATGQPVLSFRLAPQPFTLVKGPSLPIQGAELPGRWRPLVSGGAQLRISRTDGGITCNARLSGNGGWVYPLLVLDDQETPTSGCIALVATLASVSGQANFRAILEETNHSAYFADFYPQPQPGETVEAVALLKTATFGQQWSVPDEGEIRRPESAIVCSSRRKEAPISPS